MSTAMTFGRIFRLFCCPPLPGSITAKIAFVPPPKSYYFERIGTTDRYRMIHRNNPSLEPQKLVGFFATTRRGNRIACVHVKCTDKARFTLLFSHGNAVDLGLCIRHLISLGAMLKCDVVSYDYSGYGVSGGTPNETNLYSDIAAVWKTMKIKFGISSDNVILYGYSIGTVPTIRLATKESVAGVVVHSGLMSGLRVAFPKMTATLWCDPFPSVDRMGKILSPTLVIHGTDDDVVDFSHGVGLHENCPMAVEPLWVVGGGHNDLESSSGFFERLNKFLNEEIYTV